jgi:hypothetical protein
MSNDIVVVEPQTDIAQAATNTELLGNIKHSLVAFGISSDLIAQKIYKLMNAKGVTNSWIEFDDNKTILETVKLVLKLGGIKGLGDWPQIAIFNNMPSKDEKLKY